MDHVCRCAITQKFSFCSVIFFFLTRDTPSASSLFLFPRFSVSLSLSLFPSPSLSLSVSFPLCLFPSLLSFPLSSLSYHHLWGFLVHFFLLSSRHYLLSLVHTHGFPDSFTLVVCIVFVFLHCSAFSSSSPICLLCHLCFERASVFPLLSHHRSCFHLLISVCYVYHRRPCLILSLFLGFFTLPLVYDYLTLTQSPQVDNQCYYSPLTIP